MSDEMITENYCECDDVLHAVFNSKDFYDFKVGRIRCKCGAVIVPCNECLDENGQHYNCSECPWKNAEIKDAMTDKEYMLWCKKNEPETYEMYKGNSNGSYYHEIIREIENGQ